MEYATAIDYAARELDARSQIAEPIVIMIANKASEGLNTKQTAFYLAEQFGLASPASEPQFVQGVRDRL